jgi:hypothetical protein
MRRNARRDANEPAVIDALEAVGYLVQPISMPGVADLLVLRHRVLSLVEVKDGSRKPSEQRLTPKQILWHARWREAPLYTVRSVEEALALR